MHPLRKIPFLFPCLLLLLKILFILLLGESFFILPALLIHVVVPGGGYPQHIYTIFILLQFFTWISEDILPIYILDLTSFDSWELRPNLFFLLLVLLVNSLKILFCFIWIYWFLLMKQTWRNSTFILPSGVG